MELSMYKPALMAAFITALLAVIIGAFGAHKLKEFMEPKLLESFETGVKYQYYHAFALAIAGIIYAAFPSPKIIYAFYFFIIGILLFSGSIYVMTLLKSLQGISIGKFGLITPIGGLCFIVGWLFLLLSLFDKK